MLKSLWNVHSYQQLFPQTQMIRHFENPRRDVIIATWYERKFLFRDIHVSDSLHVIFFYLLKFSLNKAQYFDSNYTFSSLVYTFRSIGDAQ